MIKNIIKRLLEGSKEQVHQDLKIWTKGNISGNQQKHS